MNRTVFILGPLVGFLLSAVLAWLPGKDDGGSMANQINPRETPRRRDAVQQQADAIGTALARMEDRIFNPTSNSLPREACDAKGMEELLGLFGSGQWSMLSMFATEYAEEWAMQSPEEMLAWVLRRNETRIIPLVGPLFGTWSKNDLHAALAAWEKIPNPELRGQALVGVLPALHAADPERARRLLLANIGLFAHGDQPALRWPVAAEEVGNRMTLLEAIPESRERTRLMAALVRSVDDGKSMRACWAGLAETERRSIVAINGLWHSGWETLDGYEEMAREHAEASGEQRLVSWFIHECGERWARRDLEGALAWVDTHGKGHNQNMFRGRLLKAAAAEDLDNTLRVWRAYPDGYRKRSMAEDIIEGAPDGRKREVRMLTGLLPTAP